MKNNADIPFGSKIWVDYPGYRHFGIYLGLGRVAHGSKEREVVRFDSLDQFSCSRVVHHFPPPPDLRPGEVWKRVLSALGTSYSLFNFNCEHFVNWVQTGKPESRQIDMGLGFASIAALIAVARGSSFQKSILFVVGFGLVGVALANAYSNNNRIVIS